MSQWYFQDSFLNKSTGLLETPTAFLQRGKTPASSVVMVGLQ